MDGSRGATGSVDVGVSHLNMNINVTAGGLGSVGIQGSNDPSGDSASVSSSPPVGFGTTNGGLPSGRSRSPGFDVDPPGAKPDGVSAMGTDGSASNAAAFLAGATVVTGASSTSTSTNVTAAGRGWGAAPGGDDGRKDVDHAFTGAMLQRSSSAPPMSDHVDGWSRSVPVRGTPGMGHDGVPGGPSVDNDYYYYYYAPHSINPRMAGSTRDGLGGSRMLAAPIAQSRAHVLDKASLRDSAVGDPTVVADGVLSGRSSPLTGEADAVAGGGGGGVAGPPGGAGSSSGVNSNHFRKLNGAPGVGGGGAGSGDEGHVGGPAGGPSAALSSRVKAAAGVAVGNGPARSASPPGFPDIARSGTGSNSGAVADDRAFDIHSTGGGGGGASMRYGVSGSPESGSQQLHPPQHQQQHLVAQHRQPQEPYGNVPRGNGNGGGGGMGVGGAGGDFVAAMSALSLGGGANKPMPYGGGSGQQQQQQQQQHGGMGSATRMDPYNNHMMDSRGGLHGIMPPSPYSGPQMSPYGGPQVPSAAIMGNMAPLTPEMHPGSMMNYQLDPRHLAQLPPPDPRFDASIQNDRGGLGGGGGGLGGGDPGSHMRGGDPRMVTGGNADASYYPGQGMGGQQGYGLDPRSYPRVLQSPRGPTGYGDPMGMYQQDQSPVSPMLGPRRLPADIISAGGAGGGGTNAYGYHGGGGNAGGNGGGGGLDPRMGGGGGPGVSGRMRGRGGGGGHIDQTLMSPRTGDMGGDPYYGGGGGRGGYHPGADGRLGVGGGGGGAPLRYGGGGGGAGGRGGLGLGVGMGPDDVGDMRGGGIDLRDVRGGDMMRGGGDMRAVDGRGDLRGGGGMDMAPGVELGYRDAGGGGGGGGGRRSNASGNGMAGIGGGVGGDRMMRGPTGHPRDLDGGMHGGADMRLDPRTAGDRMRGAIGAGAGDMMSIRDQRGMTMRGGDHRDTRRPDLRHGRDNGMGGGGDRGGPRGGGYLDNRGLRDRDGRLTGGRPGGMGGGMGVGPGGAGGRGSLLDEFRSSIGKNRKWELQDLHGHTVQFCRDQHGSRFIQQKLEVSSEADKEAFFDEILPHTQSLMTDVFGNYVVQKLFDNGSPSQRENLASFLVGHAVQLSLQMYGCRVVQKALEYASIDTLIALVSEFGGQVMKCVQDQNGNHVVQKCIEVVSTTAKTEGQYLHSHIQFIIDGFVGQVEKLSMHAYGCRVIQRILEHCVDEQKQVILEEIKDSFSVLIQDQYGNYVIQHVLKHGRPTDRGRLMREVKENLLVYSQHKFASNVVEKCLQYGTKEERGVLIQHLLYGHTEGTSLLQVMVCDPYANYVVQKIIDVADQEQRQTIIMEIRTHASQLKRYTFGKHIISRLEKLSGKKM